MLKRIFDIAISVIALPVVVAVCSIIGLLYFLVERESPFFTQTRVGRYESKFTLYKLRTMKRITAELGTHEVDRSSVTRLGSFLRATKLDELPQLWNVFLGQMSLVGPRPGLVSQNQLIVERRKLDVFSVRPGITGQSQLNGVDMSDPLKLAESDARYIAEANFLSDLKILALTALGVGTGDSVKRIV